MFATVRGRRAVVGAAVLSLALGACTNAEEDKGKLKATCAKIKCEGERGGARYKLQLPDKWNGTLLIYSHGYRQPEPVPPDNEPVDTSAANAPSPELATDLLAQGYALVGSSYKSNGWAVLDGVEANEDLYRWFTKEVGTPAQVYVWGHSLGGLITEVFAEKHPDWVDGVLPMCGVLGGTNLNLDLGLDVTYAIKTLGIYPEMKLTDFASFGEAVDNFEAAYAAILAATRDTKVGVPKLLVIGAITDGAKKTGKYDGSDPVSMVSAIVESLVRATGYGTFGRYEIEQRVGGNPSTNEDAAYADRISEDESKLIEAVAPGSVATLAPLLDAGERIPADPAARAMADTLGNPTGSIKDPTLTLHTAFDPLVLAQNATVFAERVNAAADREGDLVQLFSLPPAKWTEEQGAPFGAGHCNFSREEHLGALALLDDWVRNGVFPSTGRINAQFRPKAFGTVGNYGIQHGYDPGPWPTEAIE